MEDLQTVSVNQNVFCTLADEEIPSTGLNRMHGNISLNTFLDINFSHC